MRLVVMLVLVTALECCTAVSTDKLAPIPIITEDKPYQFDSTAFKVSTDIDPAKYRDKEVQIFKSTSGREGFKVVMYRVDNGKLKSYQAFIEAENDYSIATYEWVNDYTVLFRLWDNKTRMIESFNLVGRGNTTKLLAAE